MSSLPICKDVDYLSINSWDAELTESIREIAALGGVLHWDRQGDVRVVPNALLRDVLETYDFWASAPDKFQADAPKDIGRIYWGDTHAVRRSK